MSTTTTTYTVTPDNGSTIAALVNDLAATGDLQANGREVWSLLPGRPVSRQWQNGSVSVLVRGRKPGTQGEIFVKDGETLTLTTDAPIFREGASA